MASCWKIEKSSTINKSTGLLVGAKGQNRLKHFYVPANPCEKQANIPSMWLFYSRWSRPFNLFKCLFIKIFCWLFLGSWPNPSFVHALEVWANAHLRAHETFTLQQLTLSPLYSRKPHEPTVEELRDFDTACQSQLGCLSQNQVPGKVSEVLTT